MSAVPETYYYLTAIGGMAGAVAWMYRESAARAREYAEEWHAFALELKRVLEENTKNQEQIVASQKAMSESDRRKVDMMTDIWYVIVPPDKRRPSP